MPTPLIRTLVATTAAAASLAAASPGAAQVPSDFVGVVSEDAFKGGVDPRRNSPSAIQRYREETLTRQAEAGIRLIRQPFDWARVETSPGEWDLHFWDEFVAHAASKGIQVMPILFHPPDFRSSKPRRGARKGTYPPKRYRDLGTLGRVLVRRYGPEGTLWAERPELPRLPIRSYQIWNEPNLRAYWPTGPNPRQYTKLLRAAAGPIIRADPGAEIVTAGLPDSPLGMPLVKFVRGMYRAGARRYFDSLAINPYARNAEGVVRRLRQVRSVMNAHGDRHKTMWATELGWATGGRGRSPQKVGTRGQRAQVGRVVQRLTQLRLYLGLRGFVYYSWRDAPPYPPDYRDFWGLHTGLLDISGNPKPSLTAFEDAVSAIGL